MVNLDHTADCGCRWRMFEIAYCDVFGDVTTWLSWRQITWCGPHRAVSF